VIALDTNVLVRVLTADDPAQLAAARAAMGSGPLWLAKTVLLETEWVLRHAYGLDRPVVGEALAKLVALADLQVEDPDGVRQALRWYAGGLDFADALHLGSCLGSSARTARLVTFDRGFAAGARRLGTMPPVDLLQPAES
jgi:predicted nucleic-acid-binding protein